MKTLTASGVDFAVRDEGLGPPLLLVHGFPLDGTMWKAQCDEFAASHRVIAPDLRGFGGSRLPEHSGVAQAASVEQLADDLNALLDALKVEQPIVFCGLSMGGYIAWQFWKKYGHRVRALILCDTRSGADSVAAVDVRKKMAAHVMAHGTSTVAEAMLPKLLCAETLRSQPETVANLRDTILSTDPAAIAAGQLAMAARPDMSNMLPRIEVPTLLIAGEEDEITTVEIMQADARAIPRAELVTIPRAGHMAPLEQPATVNRAFDRFLRSLVD